MDVVNRTSFFVKACARLLTCVSIAWLAGCANAPIVELAALPAAAVDLSRSGLVVVSVTGNTARAGQFDNVVLTRVVASGERPVEYILKQVSQGLARDTALFVGVVAPGEYWVKRLNVGLQYIEFGDTTRARLGQIKVTPGGVHDLGRLVVTALNRQVLIGRSRTTTANAELINRFVPETAPYLKAGLVDRGWVADRDAADRVEEYAASTPVGADGMLELSTGEVIAASRMGTVLLREPVKGRWRIVRSGRLESLLSVVPVDGADARLVAVGEFNSMVKVTKDWKPQWLNSGNLPPGNLIFVAGNQQAGWYVAQQHRETITIYRSEQLDHGDWKAVKAESIEPSFWSGSNSFWAWTTEKGFAYAISQGTIWWFDFAGQAWRETRAPFNSRIQAIAVNPDRSVGILTSPGGGFAGLFASHFLTRDAALSWAEVKSPAKVLWTPPTVTASGLIITRSGTSGRSKLHGSRDNGKTWAPVSESINTQDKLIALPTQGLFAMDDGAASDGITSMRHSSDDGQTWQLEYSNFNRSAD